MGTRSETHRLDAVGNRTGEKRLAQVLTPLTVAFFAAFTPAQTTAAVERQHNAVGWALSSDANGNRTAEGARRYRWDIRDTLTQVEDGASVVGTYDYDAKLQRVKADTAQGHVAYVLDGKYVLREAGARQRRYHFGEGEALAVTGVGGTGAQDRWLHTDALGSVVTETDATASSVTARQFDAWGNYRNSTAPGVGETRLGYTGHQFDVETGLTYARARYYDSKLGVFLSRDSFEGVLTEAPSLHRYTYAHNQPLKYRDPSGRWADWGLVEGMEMEEAARVGKTDAVMARHQQQDRARAAGVIAGAAAVVGAEAGAAQGLVSLATGVGRSALWTVRTVAIGYRAGATGTGLALAGETAADLGSVALNAYQCAQGDQSSCAGMVASAIDAVTGPSLYGDEGGGRALSKLKLPRLGGAPEVVGQESTSTPATKLQSAATKPSVDPKAGSTGGGRGPPSTGGGGGGSETPPPQPNDRLDQLVAAAKPSASRRTPLPAPTPEPEDAPSPESFTVRRFMSADELKQLRKDGLTFDPRRGEGIPTTTTNFTPKSQDHARGMTGAVSIDYQVDLDVSNIPRGPTTNTRRGLPEYPIQGDIGPERIVPGTIRKVPK